MDEPFPSVDAPQPMTDLYGFDIPHNVVAQAVRLQCDGAALRAERAWAPYIQEGRLPSEHKLKDMVRLGVPPTLRPWVWMEASGAAAKRAAFSPSYYTSMALAGEKESPHLKQIDQDVKCAFPNHPWLQSEEGQTALRRVLAAFSLHNPKVGYTRPLSHIVGLLLVALNRNQESAFWLLAQLVEGTLYDGTYSPNLVGCQVEMRALEDLMSTKLPRLAAHMAALEADVSIIATDWYLSLFASSMPSESAARVWDALMNEGPKVLFRVALALLSLNEERLLAFDNAGEMIIHMRQAAAAMHDRDRLMEVAGQSSKEVEAALRDRQSGARPAANTAQQQAGHGGADELRELREKAGMLTAVAASGLKKGFGALVAAGKKAASGGDRKGSGGGVPAAFD
ncbi:TBC1 domain family member 2A [Monoraphidium neglectum]|uniref:TBC1 domain family member 2A n=1 Tax=Monoraphidium neglectum TaxID=145388 RepID=A0A0D2MZQ7_9CHLO|nr:TBC1 domain family member 2A [Monoraphidium neglectum]KIY99590.1 TBC1 domain family member 2A [Monoraphidium neglectum]|eukprot:XP_013898610.1 TBC1 domain family member 2A [Monoraphidium neglectum]